MTTPAGTLGQQSRLRNQNVFDPYSHRYDNLNSLGHSGTDSINKTGSEDMDIANVIYVGSDVTEKGIDVI